MKRLAKVEHAIEELLKKQAKRYNKPYPGEMVRFNTKRLPLLQNQKATDPSARYRAAGCNRASLAA